MILSASTLGRCSLENIKHDDIIAIKDDRKIDVDDNRIVIKRIFHCFHILVT